MSIREDPAQFQKHGNLHSALDNDEEYEPRPVLPARPHSSLVSKPPVPQKPKSLSRKLTDSHKNNNGNVVREPALIDLEDSENDFEAPLVLCHPKPEDDDSDAVTGQTSGTPPLPPRPSPSLSEANRDFKFMQINVPAALKSLPANAASTAKNAQAGAAKAFGAFTNNAQKQLGSMSDTIKQIPLPTPMKGTLDDIADLSRLRQGKPGLCSWCAQIPINQCFTQPANVSAPYVLWTTHLRRIAKHGSWCTLCKLLLEMLYREECDPVMKPFVRDRIEPDWLRGTPFKTWVAEGHIMEDAYWPFGRSENAEDSAYFVTLPQWGERLGTAALQLSVSLAGAQGRRRKNRRYQPRRRDKPTFPISALVMITISTITAERPGLLWVDLMGCNNRADPEETVLSHFMLRAVSKSSTLSVEPQKPLSYGHVLDKQWIELSLAKLWLAECETRHGKSCSEHGWAAAMERPRFLRLIDVVGLCVISTDASVSSRFVALSYVWGGANTLKLQKTNMAEFSRPNGLLRHLSSIPRTVLDAMEVVRAVGERYLWCDALCIMQDDSDESHQQINQMDRVYGSAIFTIVAAAGENAQSGLLGVRRVSQFFAGVDSKPRAATQPVAAVSDDMSVIAPYDRSQSSPLSTGNWDSRAWTFQERLLSRRLLIFSEDEMVWHCRTMIAREDMPIEHSGYTHPPLQWLALQPRHLGVDVDSHWKDGNFEVTRHGYTYLVRSTTFAEYASLVAQYSKRGITYQSDVIKALAGMLHIFSLAFQSECIAGLPTIVLDIALLWQPVQPLCRRAAHLGFPSWSWAGWEGQIQYRQPIRMLRDDTGVTFETEGIRPLLRYFVFNKLKGGLEPLNGTARGIPMTDDQIPTEWHASGVDAKYTTPDLFALDAKTVPHIDDTHLLFYTVVTDRFELVMDSNRYMVPPEQLVVLDATATRKRIVFQDHSDRSADNSSLIVLGEASGLLFVNSSKLDGFGCYLVMLIEEDRETGISRRLGLGTVLKQQWNHVQPQRRLICLG